MSGLTQVFEERKVELRRKVEGIITSKPKCLHAW